MQEATAAANGRRGRFVRIVTAFILATLRDETASRVELAACAVIHQGIRKLLDAM